MPNKRHKKRNTFRILAVIIVLTAFALWLMDVNPFSSETTVYSIYCGKDTGEEGKCIDLASITYEVFPDRQEVAYWTDTGTPATLTDCTVRDRRNWECWYKDRAGRLSMAKGAFHEEVLKAIPGRDAFDSVRYVPKWKWWAIKIGIRADG